MPPPLGGDGGWRLTAQFAPHSWRWCFVVSCMELERARARPVWRSGRISSSSSKLSIYFSLGTTHEALLGGVDVGLGVSATDSVSVEQVRAFRRGAAQPVQDVSAG